MQFRHLNILCNRSLRKIDPSHRARPLSRQILRRYKQSIQMQFSGCRSDIKLYHRNKSSRVRPRSALSPRSLLSQVLTRGKRVVTRHKLATINYTKQRSMLICLPYTVISYRCPWKRNNCRNFKVHDFALTNCFFDKNVRLYCLNEMMRYIQEC